MHWWSSILSFFSETLLDKLSDSEEKDSALRGIRTLVAFRMRRIIKVRVLYILSVLALCWIRLPQKHLNFFWWSKLFTSYCFSVLFPLCHYTKCFLQKLSKWIPPVVHTIEWFREGTFFIGGGGGGGRGPRRGGSLLNFLQIEEGQTGFIPNWRRVSFFGMEKNYSMSLSWLLFVNKHAKCVET